MIGSGRVAYLWCHRPAFFPGSRTSIGESSIWTQQAMYFRTIVCASLGERQPTSSTQGEIDVDGIPRTSIAWKRR